MDDRVFGRRYRLTEKIGTGGMADVFKAVDEVLGRTVAVKVLHPRYAADPNFAARFRQEAQAAANLQSPYIVNIYDWGQDGDTYYIVMEWVRGIDLKTLIQQQGPLESRKAAEIGVQVCSALAVAHGYDIIHRDIKPHNIMVTPDGSVKVMDFGIARAGNTTMTQTGSVLGTAHYVSPEQAQGRPLAATSDLYSLGIVLYESVTGRLPFEADSPVAVALKQVNEQPIPPRQRNAQVDPELEKVILKAMGKQAVERYRTSEEMRQDLLRVAQGRGVAAVAPTSVPVGHADETAVLPAVTGGASSRPVAGTAMRPIPRRKPVWPWILLAALLIAAGLGIAAYMGLLGTQNVMVPDLTGKTVNEAETILSDLGLVLGAVEEEFSDVEAGLIVSHEPGAASPLVKGGSVDVVVSKGPEMIVVPQLIGLTEVEAQEALKAAGLQASPMPDEFSEFERGKVFKQTPEPGAEVEKGSAVQYVVSSGRKIIPVPKVTGETRKDAEAALTGLGFKVSVREVFSDSVAQGRVASQNPSEGTEVIEGSTITISVSKGPENVLVPDVIGRPTDDAKATLESAGLKVKIAYDPHAETDQVLDQSPKGGQSIKRGSTVTIYVDSAAP